MRKKEEAKKMTREKKKKEKTKLHPRNRHRERYDFTMLTKNSPELTPYVTKNEYGDLSVDFFDPKAVLALNKALLTHYYDINYWEIPKGYLCPPIPGRADYIHHMADLLTSHAAYKKDKVPSGSSINCLDIGVGANCVYPIIGVKEYGWSFVGSDVDAVALASAQKIVAGNEQLKDKVRLRLQPNTDQMFRNIIRKGELFDMSICNPPFHGSAEEAKAGAVRKLQNLKGKKIDQPVLNFGGQHSELWYEGGGEQFVKNMIQQSRDVGMSCFWFSTLISKQRNLARAERELKKVGATAVKVIAQGQGNKSSRILAWTFLDAKQQKLWVEGRMRF